MAQEVRTPKYRKRVVEDKRKKQINDDDYWIVSSYEGVETYIKKKERKTLKNISQEPME